MVITSEWQWAVEVIWETVKRPLIVMVVGAVDTGKTTFCTYLARTLFERGLKVAIVDADLGQSDIGLPTTIGMGFVSQPVEQLSEVKCQASYFVGSISPVGFLLPTVTGTKLMTERAFTLGAEAVVLDTDGLVHGSAGIALKQYTFELIRPTHVVLLQRARELEVFEQRWKGITWTKILTIPTPKGIPMKTREQRRRFREQRFGQWLSQCGEILLPLTQLRFRNAMLGQGITVPKEALERLSELVGTKVLHAERVGDNVLIFVDALPLIVDFTPVRQFFGGAPYIRWTTSSRYEQVIVGLLDSSDELIAVGLTFKLDFQEGILSVLSPPIQTERVHTVVFGAVRLALDGTELGTIAPGTL